MSNERYPEICVVTHPLGPAGENATRTLLEILSAITTVSLITADLPENSAIRDRHEVVELTDRGTGDSLPVAAGRFILNQLRMCRIITQRDEDIMLFFGATAYLLPIVFSRLTKRTVVLEPRGDVPLTLRVQWDQRVPTSVAAMLAGVVDALETAGYYLSNAIITYTPSMAEELGLQTFDGKLNPNGARYIDTDQFSPQIPYEGRKMRVGFRSHTEKKNSRARASPDTQSKPAKNNTFCVVCCSPSFHNNKKRRKIKVHMTGREGARDEYISPQEQISENGNGQPRIYFIGG